MIRLLLRLVGLVMFAAGFVALVIDGSRSIAAGSLLLTPVGSVIDALMPGNLERIESSLRGAGAGIVWDWVFICIAAQPLSIILSLAGLILMLLGRKRRPPLGLKPL